MAAVAENPTSPVPLDTIPVTPAGGENGVELSEKDTVTVFHDPNNFNVKHPLAHTWTLWFTKPPSGKVCLPKCLGRIFGIGLLTITAARLE